MRLSLVFVLVALFAVSPMFAQSTPNTSKAIPGQIMGLEITAGYHLSTSIVFNGNVNIAGNGMAKNITVFVNDFSTVVTPEGRFAISFPTRSINPDNKGTIVKIRAFQNGTNLLIEKTFDLALLNEKQDSEIKFKEIYK